MLRWRRVVTGSDLSLRSLILGVKQTKPISLQRVKTSQHELAELAATQEKAIDLLVSGLLVADVPNRTVSHQTL